MDMDPRSSCFCVDKDDMRKEIYPSRANPYDIHQASDEMFLCEMHFVDINYLDQSVRQYTKERRTSTWFGLY